MRNQRANPDVAIAEIAARQHGVVSVQQLRAAGLDKHRVVRRVKQGRLHPVHRGVYAVGHKSLSQEGRWMAATLAIGDRAVLSHWSAAALWKLLPDRAAAIDVSVQGDGGKRPRRGIHLHRRAELGADLISRCRGIPVTTPAQSVADLQRTAPEVVFRRAVRQAEFLGLPIGSVAPLEGTRSELESRFLDLCRRNRIPAPAVNARIGSLMVDFVWHDRRLVVETDGYRYHRGRIAFEDDRARDLRLRELGYDVIRLTCRQIETSPAQVCAAVGRALGRGNLARLI